MTSLAQYVRKIALENGADLVGFAPITRFESAPPELHPWTIFPQTRTVVAIAVRQPRGALKAVEEGSYWQPYTCDSYSFLNEILAPLLLRSIVMFLESEGYTSVPVHNPFWPHMGKNLREDQPAGPDGFVSLRVIGVAAGLGELGHSKLLLTPQFGPRQRIMAVFTDAELEPTPLFTGEVCDGCLACVQECQAHAIGENREIKFTIEGRKFSHASLDQDACLQIHLGGTPRCSPFWTGKEVEGEIPEYHRALLDTYHYLGICVGRGCLRSCLDHLEKTARIQAIFKTPLIQRERWRLD